MKHDMESARKRQIAILGSTGSIGTQTLQVVEEHPECFEVYAITANTRVDDLIAQARKFMPEAVVIADETKYGKLKDALSDLPIKVYGGYEAICQIVESGPIDVVVTAMVGFSGLRPTINAIKAGKAIALANKETMVVAGEMINALPWKTRRRYSLSTRSIPQYSSALQERCTTRSRSSYSLHQAARSAHSPESSLSMSPKSRH